MSLTDFVADIRYRCAIHSASGSMMVIPRENKYVRLYIQVTKLDENEEAVNIPSHVCEVIVLNIISRLIASR